MAKLLSEKDEAAIKDYFTKQLVNPVTLRLFVQDPNHPEDCMYCSETEQITREVADLSDKIELIIHQAPSEKEIMQKYDVQRVPALILEKEEGQAGVRFYGIPSGYEFGTLIEDIAELSTGETKLAPELVKKVQQVDKDVTIKVFVTPT